MENIIRRLNEAEEELVFKSILSDALKAIQTSEEDNVPRLLLPILQTKLLFEVVPYEQLFDLLSALCACADPVITVPMLAKLISLEHSGPLHLKLLTTIVSEHLVDILQKSMISDEKDEAKYTDFVTSLASLKDRGVNCMHRIGMEKVETCIRDWFNGFEELIFKTLENCLEIATSTPSCKLNSISTLIFKARHLSHENQNLIERLVHFMGDQKNDVKSWVRIAQNMFCVDTDEYREYESVIIAVVLAARSCSEIEKCLGQSITSSPCVRMVCCRRLIIQRNSPIHVVKNICDYIWNTQDWDLFLDTFKMLVMVWADPASVKTCATELQMFRTRCVLIFGRKMNNRVDKSDWNAIFPTAIEGVQARLDSSDSIIRQSGMFVGEMFSKWMGNDNSLSFDYDECAWLNEMRCIAAGTPHMEGNFCNDNQPSLSAGEVPNENSNLDEDDDDDEEDFTPKEVPDSEKHVRKLKENEEPEKTHPPPNYIRDAMERLSENEKYEVFESAFFNLDRLIRRKALGFEEIAPQLARSLIFLIDRFSSKNFEEVQRACLVSCLVQKPDIAPFVIEILFSRNCSFHHRYLILRVVGEACRELSNPPSTSTSAEKKSLIEEIKPEISEWRAVVDERIRLKTRIISRPREKLPESASRFAGVASKFFDPLMNFATFNEPHLQLRERDSVFLSKLLFCIGEVLQCSSSSPEVLRMSRNLVTAVAPLRFNDDPAVRASVMFCYFSVASSLRDEVFFSAFGEDSVTWLDWCCQMVDNVDLSEMDRGMARHVAAALLAKLKSAEDELNKIKEITIR